MSPHHGESVHPAETTGLEDSAVRSLDQRRREMGEQLKAQLDELRLMPNEERECSERHPFQQIHSSGLHEAGHAVLAVVLGRKLKSVTVVRDMDGDGLLLRTKSDQTPTGIVEEILIAYAGRAAADELYGLPTPGNHDQDKINDLNDKLPPQLTRVTPEDAGKEVIATLKTLRLAVEDLAVALVTHGTLAGKDAEPLIMKHLSLPAAQLAIEELREHIANLAARKKPVFALGWGKDGCDDVDEVANFYGHDQGLYCVRADSSIDSRKVLQTIEDWLNGHVNARHLYLGMHGTESELRPETEDTGARITYCELAARIKKNFCEKGGCGSMTVFLGACQSEHAASIWKSFEDLPVRLLIAFSGDEDVEVVREALGTVLQQWDLLLPGKTEAPKAIDYLDEDVEALQKQFPNIRIFYKHDRTAELSVVPEGKSDELGTQLERRGRVGKSGLLLEAVRTVEESSSECQTAIEEKEPNERTKVAVQMMVSRPAKSKSKRKRR
jgi:hypothetical protein